MSLPYFVYPFLLELHDCHDPRRSMQLKELIAANVGEYEALADLISDLHPSLRNFSPENEKETIDPIDSFIKKFGGDNIRTPELLVLPTEEEEDPMEKVKKLVKNRQYEEALEIMEAIYLNNPKKSIYFADQIRFVRKMMLHDRKKTL